MLETALKRQHSSVLSVLTALVRSCRPHQWVKNLPVFAAVMFTPEELVESSLVVSVLCFIAQTEEIINVIVTEIFGIQQEVGVAAKTVIKCSLIVEMEGV